ncbi:Succinate dehydrogenase iron-sulfur protein [Rubellimicrobium mesophilum DSM 19309]|uniref:Succinate dehydrogenase iron-sulfur protein n=1 Tax=Rubellimicrobium mesophilum DSM 19309 TaxID=442562 RepID=A0A017HWF6_9RHOB|nr:Succinate dehydrogenase iron-sulfur protein [Rubellimicrobium mesophilum DSM 19309]
MVQLRLPKNSRMSVGKTWPKPEGATNLKTFRIYRWSPEDGGTRASTPTSSTSTTAGR